MATTQFDADQVRDGTITNADIADDAAIAQSKIDGLVAALAAILPSQSGMAGKFLTTNGYTISWSETGSGETANVETLTADKTLTASDAPIQMYTCTANRTVNLPTTGLTVGQKFEIWNRNAYDSAYYISLPRSVKLCSQTFAIFRWDGSAWLYEYLGSIVMGADSHTNYQGAVSIGAYCDNNYVYGVGICYNSGNNHDYGVGIGSGARNNYNRGLGTGTSSTYNFNYATGLGALSTCNSKEYDTIAIGAYSKAQRNREIVSTATQSTTNLAQLIIQKYREKDLATASAAWQELFIDGSSARLSIIASSVYNFRAQINAIDVTNNNIKCWEITGCIKRNASNVTSLVGTPTVTVIAADTAAANWDARITADDTNEALKVEVKHDSANNVRFSLNIYATETRI